MPGLKRHAFTLFDHLEVETERGVEMNGRYLNVASDAVRLDDARPRARSPEYGRASLLGVYAGFGFSNGPEWTGRSPGGGRRRRCRRRSQVAETCAGANGKPFPSADAWSPRAAAAAAPLRERHRAPAPAMAPGMSSQRRRHVHGRDRELLNGRRFLRRLRLRRFNRRRRCRRHG